MKRMNIFGKRYSMVVICVTIMLYMVSCDYGTTYQIGRGTIQVDSLASLEWHLTYHCMNASGQQSKLIFECKGPNSYVKNFGVHDNVNKCFVVNNDSLKVSLCDTLLFDTLKVGIVDVKTYIGKANINNSDTISSFEANLGWLYKLQKRKVTYIKIYPCGYLKYNGENLLKDTVVISIYKYPYWVCR